jgi:hypothetical protein
MTVVLTSAFSRGSENHSHVNIYFVKTTERCCRSLVIWRFEALWDRLKCTTHCHMQASGAPLNLKQRVSEPEYTYIQSRSGGLGIL